MTTRRYLPKNSYFVLVSPDSEDLRKAEMLAVGAPDAFTAAFTAGRLTAGWAVTWIVISILDGNGQDYTATPLLANINGNDLRRVRNKLDR